MRYIFAERIQYEKERGTTETLDEAKNAVETVCKDTNTCDPLSELYDEMGFPIAYEQDLLDILPNGNAIREQCNGKTRENQKQIIINALDKAQKALELTSD